ncbi:TPA: phage portal protein [Vibrio parahaemolyticus]|nr:phage portal protein [Vibrio parahaemolyticus]HCE2322287.1 phage portal protein [Vibrio parahaemolyticus]HCE2338226.1 phage portal protein [Vibrio parahaemolyticus]HCE2353957.1 phage portal protein [Vibrio parahaemolyticus]HCE2359069.1 phage portal protein [Vibrio parahaemolyticus]
MKLFGFEISRSQPKESRREFSSVPLPTAIQKSHYINTISQFETGLGSQSLVPPAAVMATRGKQITAQARYVATSSPFIESALNSIISNVIGSAGFEARISNESVAKKWADWCEAVDADREHTLAEFLGVALRSWIIDGDALVIPWDLSDGFALQLVDAALLDHDFNQPRKDGVNAVVNGIELDQMGRKVNYLFQPLDGLQAYDHYTTSTGRTRNKVKAGDVVHMFKKRWAGQVRGVSELSFSLGYLDHLAGYVEAEILAKRAASSKVGLLSRHYGENGLPIGNQYGAAWGDAEPDPDGYPMGHVNARLAQNLGDLEAGSINIVPEGYSLNTFDPTHTTEVDNFIKILLRSVAGGLGLSYTTLTGDLSDVNYSSIRTGMLEEREQYKTIQEFVIRRLVKPIFEAWCKANGVAAKADFAGRRWGWVDPQKDINAAQTEIEIGVRSRSDIIRARGEDPEKVFAEIEQERELFDAKPETESNEDTQETQDDEPTETPPEKPTPPSDETSKETD